MEIYELRQIDGWGEEFATIAIVEDVRWANPREECSACYEPIHRRRLGPYVIAWRAGSDVIGDFVSKGPSHGMIFTDRVKAALESAKLTGYIAWPVEVREPKKRRESHRLPMVSYPYRGPKLWDIYTTEFVHIVPEESSVEFQGHCVTCGRPRYYTVGAGHRQRFLIDASSWNGCDFMCPHEVNAVFVTQRVADVIRQGGFTNFQIVLAGRIGKRAGRPSEVRTGGPTASAPVPESRVGSPVADDEPLEDLDELARRQVEFPPLDPEQTARYPEFVADLVEYLVLEGGDVVADDLTFLRSAQVNEKRYWIWEFYDEVGRRYYATVSESPDGQCCHSYDPAEGLTPEQFLVRDDEGW